MLKNMLTVTVRNFLRQPFYSFINVVGLSTGLTCAFLIWLWVTDETSVDRFHHESEKIYHVVCNLEQGNGDVVTWPITPGPLAEAIRESVPEVEIAVRTIGTGSLLFQYGEKSFMETGLYADPDFFRLFSFPILQGKPSYDSTDIVSISISKTLAQKLFEDEDPVGKMVTVNQKYDFTVAAVFDDITPQSSIQFEYILPLEIYKRNRGTGFNWGNFDHPLYLRLTHEDKVGEASAKINHIVEEIARAEGYERKFEFYLQPFADYYLYSTYEKGRPVGGRIQYVKIFSIVAIFIVVIACINFMNMATARATRRMKEVGVRKAIGAQKRSLIVQFIVESTLTSFLSMILALVLTYLALPHFNTLVSKKIVIDFTDIRFLTSVGIITLVTGVLAGSYPAFFLSSFRPVQVLKGTIPHQQGQFSLRKGLVVFQFALTVILVMSSLVMRDQINYIFNKNLGYDRESVLTFRANGNLRNEFEAFRNEALQFPAIQKISRANQSLVQVQNQTSTVSWPGMTEDQEALFRVVTVDYDFIETMGLKLVEGRAFSRDFNDTSNFILTRRSVETMGLENPIGQTIKVWGIPGVVVGVIDDFHSRSLHEDIDPIILFCKPEWSGWIVARLEGTQTQQAVEFLEATYKKYNPEYPFTYSFLENDFEKLYRSEKVTQSLGISFTAMAIIISGLGLLGLAAYTSERRKKEISIRKTLGASVSSIVRLISADFLKLSAIAVIIGCPVAYYLMRLFLQNFAYHTDFKWEVFAITSIGVLALALLIVAYQVIKTAMANPVDALRNE